MNPVPRLVVPLLALFATAALPAQTPAPAPAPTPALAPAEAAKSLPVPVPAAEAPMHFGLRFEEYVAVNEAMRQTATNDPEISALSERIEALVAQREALLVEKTIARNPALAAKLRTMQQGMSDLKRGRDESKAQSHSAKPAQPKS